VTRQALIARVGALQDEFARASMRSQSEVLVDQHLTLAQFRTLLYLHVEPSPAMADIAQMLAVRPNIATGVVQRLVDRGWVRRTADAQDRRVRRLSLTPQGRSLVDQIVEAAQQDFVKVVSALDDEQLGQLAGILEVLIEARGQD
jgi:DNA-binding MarR family transcriptional regulator